MHPQNTTPAAKSLYNRAYYAKNRERLLARYRAIDAARAAAIPLAESLPSEQWRPVVDYEGWYEVSDFGRVRRIRPGPSVRLGRVRTLTPAKNGYLRLPLSKGSHASRQLHSIHRLVVEAFIGRFTPGEQANHINGDKADNRLMNLEKVAALENSRHSIRTGLKPSMRGGANPSATITEAQVRQIRDLKGRMKGRQIGRLLGLSDAVVYGVLEGRTWTHIS